RTPRDRVFPYLVCRLDQPEHGHVPIDVLPGSQDAAKILRCAGRGLARMHVCQLELRLLADRNPSGAKANHYRLLHHSPHPAPNSPTATRSGLSPETPAAPLVVSSLSPKCSCSAFEAPTSRLAWRLTRPAWAPAARARTPSACRNRRSGRSGPT